MISSHYYSVVGNMCPHIITILSLILLLIPATASAASSCYGTTAKGHLVGGVKLPSSGPNFISYGAIPTLAGRTYVHSTVRNIVVDAYQRLESEIPGKVFKYAETGFKEGGQFQPHKTHRNGLSVDFIVPVVDGKGRSVHLPTTPFNKYGYDIEFDAEGNYEDYAIGYGALAAHIVSLHKAAQAHGAAIWHVIFDPQLAPNLYKTKQGDYLRQHVVIPTKPSWVRHDDHYHVDFVVECQPHLH